MGCCAAGSTGAHAPRMMGPRSSAHPAGPALMRQRLVSARGSAWGVRPTQSRRVHKWSAPLPCLITQPGGSGRRALSCSPSCRGLAGQRATSGGLAGTPQATLCNRSTRRMCGRWRSSRTTAEKAGASGSGGAPSFGKQALATKQSAHEPTSPASSSALRERSRDSRLAAGQRGSGACLDAACVGAVGRCFSERLTLRLQSRDSPQRPAPDRFATWQLAR